RCGCAMARATPCSRTREPWPTSWRTTPAGHPARSSGSTSEGPMERERSSVEAAIGRALDEEGLDRMYDGVVRRYLERDDDGWRSCCGSLCDPCVLTLGRVVDRVRE